MDTKRRKEKAGIGAVFFALYLLFAAGAGAEPVSTMPDVPWRGERLTFDLSWFKVKAGTSVLEVSDSSDGQGRKAYQISAITHSNEFVDMFHKVRDRIDSFVYADNLASFRFKVHQEEGKYRKDKEIDFDYSKSTASYKVDQEVTNYPIPAFIQDALSCLYYLRTRELAIGKTLTIDVFDDKKLWQVEIQVLRKERIQTPAGEFDTFLIKPLLKFEGIFQRKGDVYIWITDDSRKIPVRMRSKVVIGSVWAELVEYKNIGR